MNLLIKKPSAWIPLALTAVILAMMSVYFLGVIPHEPTDDEGIMAHAFQLWAVLELLAIMVFTFKWLPRQPYVAWKITALHIVVAVIPFIIVWFLEH